MKDFRSWQDSEGFIHVNENPDIMNSENGLLFTSYAIKLGLLKHIHKPINLLSCYNLNKWRGSAFGIGNHFSHDNYLGMLYLQKRFGFKFQGTSFFDFIKYKHYHPRDIILFNYIRGHRWLFPFLIIPVIACIVSALRANKNRTSGALLTFLRCDVANLKLTRKLCDNILKGKFESINEIYSIYFREEGHPCRNLSKDIKWQVKIIE